MLKKKPSRRWKRLGLLLVAGGMLSGNAGPAAAALQPLWLGLAPGSGLGPECCEVPEEFRATAGPPQDGDKAAGRPDAARANRGGGKPARFESEHRPLPVRAYFLQPSQLGADLTAFLQKADSTTMPAEITVEGGNQKISFRAAMGEGPMHGPNNLYVVASHVEGDTLVVRTAKWCTLHHNCGWGHDHKFDEGRLTARSCNLVPFEIVAHDLWDQNFHSRLMSGDELRLDVLFRNRPAAGATLRVVSEKGWVREVKTNADGRATVQMIRDSYPAAWSLFDRNEQGEVRIEARHAVEEAGTHKGRPYRRIEMVTTFPWRYYPARRDYMSLSHGLLVVTVTAAASGLALFLHRRHRSRPRREIVFDERS